MRVYFEEANDYIDALKVLKEIPRKSMSNIDAFLLLLHNIKYEDMNYLCYKVSEYYQISVNDAYKYIQEGNPKIKDKLLEFAYSIIESGKTLGSNVINNNINTSSWISHSLYEARLCEILASKLNLDSELAFNYGLLHDYGRKYHHDFRHVTSGFHELKNIPESRATLTHSFINGGRFNCNEVPDIEIKFKDGMEEYESEYDDLSKVLRNINYTDYDRILNISDLMASDTGIISPIDRIYDILSRRGKLDEANNRVYFLISFYNTLLWYLKRIDIEINLDYLDFTEINLEEAYKALENISSVFYKNIIDKEKRV